MADKFQSILQKYWGYPDFRGIQRNIIESIASGRDTLGLMPTGGGNHIPGASPGTGRGMHRDNPSHRPDERPGAAPQGTWHPG